MTEKESNKNLVLPTKDEVISSEENSPTGEGYFPLQILSEKYGYAKDHLGWLSRTGRIEAVRHGKYGKWHASEESLKKYQLSLIPVISGSKPEILPKKYSFPAKKTSVKIDHESETQALPIPPEQSSAMESRILDLSAPLKNGGQIGTVPSIALFKNDGSYSADPELVSWEKNPEFSRGPKGINAILTFAIVLGGILFFLNFYPVINLDIIRTPISKFSEILKNKIRSALDIEPIEKIMTIVRETIIKEVPGGSGRPPQTITRQVTINRNLSASDLETFRSELYDTKFKIIAIQGALSSLESSLANLASNRNPVWQLPPTNTGGIGPITLNPNRLESETLSVTGSSILGSLTVLNDFTVDTNTLYVNSTNNRVGIGTTSLETAFELVGTASISGGLSIGGSLTIGGGSSSGNDLTVAGKIFSTNLEVQGTASASYLLTGNALQVGGYSSVAYSRFGTDITSHASNISAASDVLISGDLEINGSLFIDGDTSFSGLVSSSYFYAQSGTASSPSFSFGADKNTGFFSPGSDLIAFSTGGIERLRINSSGNVGIGTTSPMTLFEVQGTASASNFLTAGSLQVANAGATVSYSRFGTDTTSHAGTISTSADLLISGGFEVNGSAAFDGQILLTKAPTTAHTGSWPTFAGVQDSTLYINPSSSVADGNIFGVAVGGTAKFVIDAEGDVFANNFTLIGITVQSTTDILGNLTVEGNSTLGDASTDVIKLTGTVMPYSLTSFPLLIKASASQTVDIFRIKDPNDNILFTLDQGTGLLTASSGFNFALGGSTATVSYSRLGTTTTTHSNYISKFNDLLISGDLEVRASVTFAGTASISNTLFVDSTNRVVGIGTTSPASTALLDLTSTTKGFLPPRVTTTQRDDISSPATGLTVYNTTLNKMNIYDSVSWKNVGSTEIGGEVTSGTSGSVLFVDASGNLGQDNTNFYWDDTNNRLGLGTSSPTTKFEVQGTASASYLLTGNTLQVGGFSSASYSRFGTGTSSELHYITGANDLFITEDLEVDGSVSFAGPASISNTLYVSTLGKTGNVGIGTSAPSQVLEVNGTIKGNDLQLDSTGLIFTISNGTLGLIGGGTFRGGEIDLAGGTAASNPGTIVFRTGIATGTAAEMARISATGNVGIGDTSPDAKLEIVASSTYDMFNVSSSINNDGDLFTINSSGFVGIRTTDPSTVFEVQGTASASYLLTGNTLQVGGFASAAYSRFGTVATTHALSATNDLLINGKLEVDGSTYFDGTTNFSGIASSSLFYAQPGTAASPSFSFAIDQDTGMFRRAINALGFSTLGTERLTILSDGNVGIGTTTPTSLLTVQGRAEFQGTASASYLLTGNTLQVGGFASAAYSRFGTGTTGHANYISTTNDLLISGDLETRGTVSFGGNASISGTFTSVNTGSNSFSGGLEVTKGVHATGSITAGGDLRINGNTNLNGIFTFGDNGDVGSIDTSDWDIGTTGNLSGIGTIAADGAYTQTGTGANTFSGSTTFSSTGLALLVSAGRAEFQGTASASYLLTGNTLQVGGFASAAYSRFGTGTTGHANYISTTDDLLISGDLEVDGSISAQFASVSQMFVMNNVASASAFFKSNGSGGTNQSQFSLGVGNGTERLNIFNNDNSPMFTISSTGNVGIGTTDPGAKLDVTNTSVGAVTLPLLLTNVGGDIDGSGVGITFDAYDTLGTTPTAKIVNTRIGVADYALSMGPILALQALNIRSSGNVGIGTTTPTSLLTVQGRAEFQGTASASYLLTGNTIQVGGYASKAFSRFGTNDTTSSFLSTSNDLLITGRLEVDGLTHLDGNASISGNIWASGYASSSTTYGSGLSDCDSATSTLAWDASTGKFSCGTDTGGSVSSNSLDFDEFVDSMTLDANLTISRGASNYFIGIGSAPSTVFEVQGTASASYLLTGNTLQVGGFASAAYSRFGTATTGYANFISTTNDLLISGDLEVNATSQFDSFVRISNSSTKAFVITDTGGAKEEIFTVDTTASTSNSGITITAGTGQTGALLELKSSGETLLTKFSDEGGLDINIASTSAFVIHNGSGVRAFVFDSSAGTASMSGQLTITVDGDAAGVDALCGSTALDGDVGDKKGETIRDCSGAPTSDYAEIYPTENDVEFGDIVVVSDLLVEGKKVENNRVIEGESIKISKLKKSSSPYDSNMIGIISNNYGDFTSAGHGVINNSDNPLPVALSGRVPVKASLENGPIRVGDRLTSSSIPGVAMKAIKAGTIVGIALEPLDIIASGSYGRTLTFMNVGYWAPDVDSLTVTASSSISSGGIDIISIFNSIVSMLQGFYELTIERGVLKIANIFSETITTKTLCIEEVCISKDQLKSLLEQNAIPASTPSPSSTPTPSPSIEPTPITTPEPTASPSVTPEITPEPTPTPEPTLSPTPTPTPSPTPEPTPEILPTPEPTPEPTLISPPPTPEPEPTPVL